MVEMYGPLAFISWLPHLVRGGEAPGQGAVIDQWASCQVLFAYSQPCLQPSSSFLTQDATNMYFHTYTCYVCMFTFPIKHMYLINKGLETGWKYALNK